MRSRDARSWMWGEALSLLEQAERLQRQFFRMGSSPAHAQVWEPPVDVIETAQEVRVLVALPGVSPDAVAICAEPGAVIVSALRAFPECAGARIHRVEIPYGRFERRIALPSHMELAGRSLADGVLELVFRKRFDEQGKEAA
ncbi:MAG: heat-shock protein Hsp20 [Betaproteobacteria bacterium RIFCSPLOWO2_02_FULL_65_24]|nr:MAG: heat-shock protein Hsp20 [Betaproteobacteria bacterium RIFCSPLOWO2_02_FULL_65_24]OGA96931.1 MAG: heat-shock protein Hsp20 [Betaproteobacteria bacterium RIFCSPLOWO2_12_FULL_66_14]